MCVQAHTADSRNLRIGIATTRALAQASGKPIAPVGTLSANTLGTASVLVSNGDGTFKPADELTKIYRDELGLDEARLAAAAYARAHEAYLAYRKEIGEVPEIAGVSAGGMPDRVKCLHVLVAHALAAGEGANPLGDEFDYVFEVPATATRAVSTSTGSATW